mgnify:CR=1 FL=1
MRMWRPTAGQLIGAAGTVVLTYAAVRVAFELLFWVSPADQHHSAALPLALLYGAFVLAGAATRLWSRNIVLMLVPATVGLVVAWPTAGGLFAGHHSPALQLPLDLRALLIGTKNAWAYFVTTSTQEIVLGYGVSLACLSVGWLAADRLPRRQKSRADG